MPQGRSGMRNLEHLTRRCFDPRMGWAQGHPGFLESPGVCASTWNRISELGIIRYQHLPWHFLLFTFILKDWKGNVLVRGMENISGLLPGRKMGWITWTFSTICQDNTSIYVPLQFMRTCTYTYSIQLFMHTARMFAPTGMCTTDLYAYNLLKYTCMYAIHIRFQMCIHNKTH